MDNRDYLVMLYDFYCELFNDKQIVFANEAHLTEYVRICNLLKASVEEAIAEENAE